MPAQPDRFEALRAAGIERIVDIPDDFPLSGRQERARAVLRSGEPFISPDLPQALDGFGPPADYLDFETINPDIPLYPGTRPYEHIPFQWSLHRVETDGHMEHHEFLASGRVDPRRELAERLLENLGGESRPIIVYSHFEAGVLDDLISALPDLSPDIAEVKDRLRDLLRVVRHHIYHGAFRGSFSLKDVAPALLPGFGYDDLGKVADGRSAGIAFLRLARGAWQPRRRGHPRLSLVKTSSYRVSPVGVVAGRSRAANGASIMNPTVMQDAGEENGYGYGLGNGHDQQDAEPAQLFSECLRSRLAIVAVIKDAAVWAGGCHWPNPRQPRAHRA